MAQKNALQPPQEQSPTERGKNILALLNNPANLQPRIIPNPAGQGENCMSFVAFPPELSKNFPGSYISPETLLNELGVKKKIFSGIANKIDNLLGDKEAQEGKPVFNIETNKDSVFGLTVWHGASNEHAQALTRYAYMTNTKGFKGDGMMRAQYQDELFSIAKPAIESKKAGERGKALRIHDDCLATGDSIVGLLSTILQDSENPSRMENIRNHGVEIMIDGPATAQGILYLKKYCEHNNIKLHIDAGYLAFGLSAGRQLEDGRREHANYITYPDELLKEAGLTDVFDWMRNKDGNIYVVGDMGDAMEGIEEEEMIVNRTIQEKYNKGGNCPWNDTREDPHGKGPRQTKDLPLTINENITAETIYMPNGGYLPYEWDKNTSKQFAESNAVIIGASRTWIAGEGYGALFYRGKKPIQE